MKDIFWQIMFYIEAALWLRHQLPLYKYTLMANGY